MTSHFTWKIDCILKNKTRIFAQQNALFHLKNIVADCKKKLLEEKTGSIYRKRKIEPVFGHLKAQLAFHRFHLRGKEGAKIDIGLALMALNLRK